METFCRICHAEDRLNALISPCKCSGTMSLVHPRCLIHWVDTSRMLFCNVCFSQYNKTGDCRICLLRDSLLTMTAPCVCRGTQRFIHYHCLKRVIETQRSVICPTCLEEYSGIEYQIVERDFFEFLLDNQWYATVIGLGFATSLLASFTRTRFSSLIDMSLDSILCASFSFVLLKEYRGWKKRNVNYVVTN